MKSALEGLKGVTKVEMDLAQDLFRVSRIDTDGPDKEVLFKAIRDLSYTPSLADGATFTATPKAGSVKAGMPPLIQKALDEAQAQSKRFVIVKGTGDN